ncbi:hypothetical protein TMatcc_002172 [Talaromyces marneffei ATCC 18224]
MLGSTPKLGRSLANLIVDPRSQLPDSLATSVPSSHSVALTRKNSGTPDGITVRIAVAISRTMRVLFSNDPPYSSVRLLVTGLKN